MAGESSHPGMLYPDNRGSMMNFSELRKIDVNDHIEKKNNLSYLSWAYAVDELLQRDPSATWEYRFFDYVDGRVPYCRIGETCMVFCSVKAFDKVMTAQLPVMNHRNQAIQNPDAFAVNTAMQRCLAKAISLHGIGLYIYAGEDLPEQDVQARPSPAPVVSPPADVAAIRASAIPKVAACNNKDELKVLWDELGIDKSNPTLYAAMLEVFNARIAQLKKDAQQ